MELYWKLLTGCLLAALLGLVQLRREYGALVLTAGCVLVITAGMTFVRPIVTFLETVGEALPQDDLLLTVKVMGIGLSGELAAAVCSDAGSSSLGKALQTVGTLLILSLTVPVYTQLLTLLKTILG